MLTKVMKSYCKTKVIQVDTSLDSTNLKFIVMFQKVQRIYVVTVNIFGGEWAKEETVENQYLGNWVLHSLKGIFNLFENLKHFQEAGLFIVSFLNAYESITLRRKTEIILIK